MPSVTSKNPQLPVPPTPSDRKVHTLCLGKTPLWPTPPPGPENDAGEPFPGPSRPLLRLAKVTQKRGFSGGFLGKFDAGFANGFPPVSRRFSGGSPATRCPWINPGPAPEYPFIRKKLSGNSVHTFKPTNPAYGKRKVSAGTWSPGKKRCRQEPNAPGGSSGGPDSRPGCLGGHIPRNVSNRPFWTERCGLCVA